MLRWIAKNQALVAAIIGITVLVPPPTFADDIPPYKINADGSQYEVTLGPSHRELSNVAVYFESKGNVSNAVLVRVSAPAGTHGRVRGARIIDSAQSEQEVLRNLSAPDSCKVLGSDFREYDGFVVSDSVSGGANEVLYHLRKDACQRRAISRYLSEINLDLSEIDQELFDRGFTITIAVLEVPFTGATLASIKPFSDGKFHGEPILLMGSVRYGDEYVKIIRRRKDRIVSQRTIPVVKYISYRGNTLSLARLRGLLRGGKATFELSGGGYVYGVCFDLSRRRQVANGYAG